MTDACYLIGPRREERCHLGFANNKGADQTAQSDQSALVIRFLGSSTSKLTTSNMLIF